MIIDPKGIPIGNSFSFKNTYDGFHTELWKKLKLLVPNPSPDQVVFAIECSINHPQGVINFWQKLSHFLSRKGFNVLMVSPMTTKHERPRMSRNFSRTDPRDALLVAKSKGSYLKPIPCSLNFSISWTLTPTQPDTCSTHT